MKRIAIAAGILLGLAHGAFTVVLAKQHAELRASVAANASDAALQKDQQKAAVTEAIDKLKKDLGEALKPLFTDADDTRALAALASGMIVGCDGSKFEEGTLGAMAYRAYSRTGACAAQPPKTKRGRE